MSMSSLGSRGLSAVSAFTATSSGDGKASEDYKHEENSVYDHRTMENEFLTHARVDK